MRLIRTDLLCRVAGFLYVQAPKKLRSLPVPHSSGPSELPSSPPVEQPRLGEKGIRGSGDERLPLCLAANRGRLGLELCEPVEMGPIVIDNLTLTFENLRFPLDLSGGVPAFRHRRGKLQRVAISASLQRLSQWLESRVRAIVGILQRPLDLWATSNGVGFGWVETSGVITGELFWIPQGPDAKLVLGPVRGIVPGQTVVAKALATFDAVLSAKFVRSGRTWTCSQVGQRISRVLLPAAGARAPASSNVNFGLLSSTFDCIRVELDTHNHECALEPSVIRALEFAELATAADDALIRGDLEKARDEYIRALERAPRHRELVLTIAELDIAVGGREHAAMGLVSETMPAITAGRVGGELFELLGDNASAAEAYDSAARSESYPPLRALLLLKKAKLEVGPVGQGRALDEAVAAAPSLAAVRWARFEIRANRGDMDGALADAQYLETCTSGSSAKFEICRRCGNVMLEAGLSQQAARFFERALRYRPDSCAAALGLAQAFVAVGSPLRAITLLERALSKSELPGQVEPASQLLLAQLLAKETSDLPQGIARVRQIPSNAQVAAEARHCEGRWRRLLGDVVGASLAWARMRELVELGQCPANVSEWLAEAAQFEREVRRDLHAAEQHLSIALRVAPHEPKINSLYREIVASIAAVADAQRAEFRSK